MDVFALQPRLQFCNMCEFRLYHSINETTGKLGWFCRACGNVQDNIDQTVCVLNTNVLSRKVNIDTLVNEYTKYDPTLPHHNIKCPNSKCDTNAGTDESKHVADVAVIRDNPVDLTFVYICTTCDHVWQ